MELFHEEGLIFPNKTEKDFWLELWTGLANPYGTEVGNLDAF